MAVSTFSWMSACSSSSDAEFRKWAQGIHDALAACGLVQTADTGQVNLATATVPAAGAYTYEVWRFNDALQATKPIFLKVEYGSISTARPSVRLTVGSGSSGAGAINGNIYRATSVLGSLSSMDVSSTEFASYASGDGSSVAIMLWPGHTNYYGIGGFTVGRSCGTDGVYTGAAVMVAGFGKNGFWTVTGTSGTDPTVDSASADWCPVTLPRLINNQSTNIASTLSQDGTTAPVMPIPLAAPGVAPWVPNHLAVVHPGDAGATSVIQVATINGEARTFRAFVKLYTTSPTNYVGSVALMNSTSVSAQTHVAIAWAV